MKKFLIILFMVGLGALSCNEFDDSAIWEELNDHKSRIEKLEELCKEFNTNIASIQTILTALQNNDFITNVAPITIGDDVVGYTITFSKSGTITIYHGEDGKDGADGKPGQDGTDGKDGADGKDGYTPVVGVKEDFDGVYYWTLDGEWLLDDNGNKIPVTGADGEDGEDGADGTPGQDGADGEDGKDGEDGADGKDGITPLLKIEDNYWFISYDDGLTWTKLGKATGEDGKDGEDGADGGDSLFDSIYVDSSGQTVTFRLSNGSSFVVPMGSDGLISFTSTSTLEISGETTIPLRIKSEYISLCAEIKVQSNGTDIVTKSGSDDWSVEINESANPVSVTVTPSEAVANGTKVLLVVTLADSKGVNHSVSRLIVYNNDGGGDTPPPTDGTDYTNLSSAGTANSYIVSEAGTYKFRTVQGNSSTSVGTVASAEVLWETFGTAATPNVGDLVSEVSYADGYISFKASSKKGNASIAAKDASGTILWSWHIWMTDQPEDQVYNNNAGTMMDRNLGATSATPGNIGALGLLYQWGRKDPFLGSESLISSTIT